MTIIPSHNLSAQNETTATTAYIDDDHPNVTIRNNSVTFTKNHFNQTNRQKYKVLSNGHYVNELDNLNRETSQTNNGVNGNDDVSLLHRNITYDRQHDNINEVSQDDNKSCNFHVHAINLSGLRRSNVSY